MKNIERRAHAAFKALRLCSSLYGPELLALGASSPTVASWFRNPDLVKFPADVVETEPVLFTWNRQIPSGAHMRHEVALFTIGQVLQPASFAVQGRQGNLSVSIVRVVSEEEVFSYIRTDESFAKWLCASVDLLFWRIKQALRKPGLALGKAYPRTALGFIDTITARP